MKVILSHSGKQHSYHVAKSLYDLGLLSKFITSSYVQSAKLQQLITSRGNKYLSKRFLKGLGGHHVESNWRFEFKEMLYRKLYGISERTLDAVYERDEKFDRYVANRLRLLDGDILWGFQGSCRESLIAAKRNGKIAICELAIAHAPSAVKILGEERQLNPDWEDSFSNLVFPSAYYARLCEEPQLADVVIGASQFTLSTLKESGVPEEKLRYLPLGFELDHIPFNSSPRVTKGRIKLLFAGRITQVKGIKYLLEAIQQFDKSHVELHLVGAIQGSGKALKAYQDHYILHPPMQQYELFKKYQEFDLFVLPTIFEGFGLVILEAMAAGLIVITTSHSIGPELIAHGSNGYIVPIRDSDAIANAIRDFMGKTSEEKSKMREMARESALKYTWNAYKMRLLSMINSLHG